jgi:heme/copper-type cytochrome/quinol oxidase subunit 3
MSELTRIPRTLSTASWGVLLLIATEAALFGTMLASYFYLRFDSPTWPPEGVEEPAVALPLGLTGVLVMTVAPAGLAALAAARGRRGAAWLLLLGAALLQGGYLAWQIVLYADDVRTLEPTETAYASVYLTLLMVHHAHVAIGLLLDLWVLVRLAGGLNRYRVLTVRVVALYWAFVAAAGVLVVLTQVSPSL